MRKIEAKPAELAVGWLGFLLALPVLIPIAGITAGLAQMSKSEARWKRVLLNVCGVVLFPLFLLALVVFIPYYALLWLLGALGLVRRELPATIVVAAAGRRVDAETYWRLDLSVPQTKPELAAETVATLVRQALVQLGETRLIMRPPETEISIDEAGPRIESWVRALQYGSSAESWYVVGGGKARFHTIWSMEQGTISAEISVEGDPAEIDPLCGSFVDAVEKEHQSVEVRYADQRLP